MTAAYVRSPHVLHRNAGPDVMAMVPGTGDVHLLSGPAAVVWDLLADGSDLEELLDEVADLYGRSAAEIASSLEGCVRDLVNRGLVDERRA